MTNQLHADAPDKQTRIDRKTVFLISLIAIPVSLRKAFYYDRPILSDTFSGSDVCWQNCSSIHELGDPCTRFQLPRTQVLR